MNLSARDQAIVALWARPRRSKALGALSMALNVLAWWVCLTGDAHAGPATPFIVAFLVAVGKAIVASIVLNLLSKAIAMPDDAPMLPTARERMIMTRSSVEPHRVIVGQVLVSGPQAYIEVSGANDEYLHIIVLLAAHEVQAIGDVYFGDTLVGDLDGSGNVTTGVFSGYMRVKKHLGADDQTADTDLVAESSGKWTTDHRLQGIAHVYLRLLNNETAFPSGLEDIRALVKGKKFMDPRVSGSPNSPIWTPNPALGIRDYWLAVTGLAATTAEIGDAEVIAAANICDERVSVVYSTPAFTIGGGSPGIDIAVTFASVETRLKTGDAVLPATTGSLAGTGLTAGTLVWWIRLSSTTGKFATSRANALAGTALSLTGAVGSGNHTLSPRAVVTASASTDKLTLESAERYIALGDGVQIATTGTLPAGLVALTTYYAIKSRDSELQLALSYALALAGSAIDLTGAGTGTLSLSHIDQARYTANGTYTLGDTPEAIVGGLMSAMAGARTFTQGQYKLYAGAYTTPTLTIDEDDLAGPVTGTVGQDARDRFNAVRGVYVDQFKYWQPSDFPAVTSAIYQAEDNNEQIFTDVEFPYATDVLRAQRLAKIHLERNRRAEPLLLPCKLTQFKAGVWDTAEVTLSRLGYASEVFRVTGWRFAWDENGPQVQLSCNTEDAAVYSWSAAEATQIAHAVDQRLPDARVVGAPLGLGSPTALSLTSERVTQFPVLDPSTTAVIKVDWDAAIEANGKYYDVQWKKSSDSTWQSQLLPFSGDTEYRIKETDSASTYNVRVRTVSTVGAKSAFISANITLAATAVVADTSDLEQHSVTSSTYAYSETFASHPGIFGSPTPLDFYEVQRVTIDYAGIGARIISGSGAVAISADLNTAVHPPVYRFQVTREYGAGSPSNSTVIGTGKQTVPGRMLSTGLWSYDITANFTMIDTDVLTAGPVTYIWQAIARDGAENGQILSQVSQRALYAQEVKR